MWQNSNRISDGHTCYRGLELWEGINILIRLRLLMEHPFQYDIIVVVDSWSPRCGFVRSPSSKKRNKNASHKCNLLPKRRVQLLLGMDCSYLKYNALHLEFLPNHGFYRNTLSRYGTKEHWRSAKHCMRDRTVNCEETGAFSHPAFQILTHNRRRQSRVDEDCSYHTCTCSGTMTRAWRTMRWGFMHYPRRAVALLIAVSKDTSFAVSHLSCKWDFLANRYMCLGANWIDSWNSFKWHTASRVNLNRQRWKRAPHHFEW
jgi:hypothetical protein